MIFPLSIVLSDLLYTSMCSIPINFLIAFCILYNFYLYFLFGQIFIEEIFLKFLFVKKNYLSLSFSSFIVLWSHYTILFKLFYFCPSFL